ncbi:MAG: efflux RND transporter periplasmic adaptor subunit, partial [Myxococcales bacterium]
SDFAQKLSEANAMLAEARAARSQARLDFDRALRLQATGSASAVDLDNARARHEAAAARTDAALARVQQAQQAVSDASLRAPISGIVLKRSLEIGALATPGMPVFSIADVKNVKVVFGVPDMVLETLKLGTEQSITTEAIAGRVFKGRITRISPWADPKSRVFEVETLVLNPQSELKVGMVASLRLDAKADGAEPPAMLPLNSIVRAKSQKGFAVFVLHDNTTPPHVELREVELGQFLGNVIPVKKGLAEGERVVVTGAPLLSDREFVRVIP